MDERSVLILTNKGDETADVSRYYFEEKKVCIEYKKKTDRVYRYSPRNITIKRNPKAIDISDKTVFSGDMPFRKIRELLDFDGIVKLFFENGDTQIFALSSISIEEKTSIESKALSLLRYWTEISKHTKIDNEQEAFLKKEFDKLHGIHPDSVLAAYVNQSPLTPIVPSATPVIFPFRYNLSQKQALEQALENKISIIEGPPGTGKTQTILNIIANLAVMRNKTMAVVSGNNAAVQNVQDKLQKNGYDFITAFLGSVGNREAFFKNRLQPSVGEWNSEHSEDQITQKIVDITSRLNHLLELANRKAKTDQELSAYILEQKHFKLHFNEQHYDEMKRFFLRRLTPETIISFLADQHLSVSGKRAERFMSKANLLFKYGFVDFKRLRADRLTLISNLQMKYYESKIAELKRQQEEIQLKLNRESFEKLKNQHEAYSLDLFKYKLHCKYKDLKPFEGHHLNYKKNFKEFIEHYPVLLSTTHSLRASLPNNYLLDYVIIDESSQVDLLTGVLALSCCKHAVIVGDTKQLPQIVNDKIQSQIHSENIEETYSYFKHNLLSSMQSVYGDIVPKVILKEHYRCHPKIIGFCNNQYYDNELIPFTGENDDDIPLRLHYTAPGNHMRRITLKGKEGSYNHREIDVFKEEILKELQINEIENEDIGFTTPYRLQVEEADKVMGEDIEIDTVHKYQGREKPIMVLSTVLDQTRSGKIGKNFVENPRLINVAISRAQKQFILVTDHALFRNSRKDIGNLIRYIEYSTLHEHVINSELISVFDLLYSEYSAKLNELQNRLVSKFRYKSENIMWRVLTDLLAKEQYRSVIFCCQIYLKDLLKDMMKETDRLDEAEKRFMKNNASVDFVIYDALNKQPLLAIEVDGFSHQNDIEQIERDRKKDMILRKYDLPLLRLPTTGSGEEKKISIILDRILESSNA